jgi:hypothetical protein
MACPNLEERRREFNCGTVQKRRGCALAPLTCPNGQRSADALLVDERDSRPIHAAARSQAVMARCSTLRRRPSLSIGSRSRGVFSVERERTWW